MAKITGGELLKRILERYGINFVFGVPGDQLYPFLNALHDSNIRFITFHDETSAAHAADAYARVTNEIGVVTATVGPGAANLIGGLYPAYSENIPMLVITAQNQTFRSYPDQGSMQALDQYELFKAVTKWRAVVNSWDRIQKLTERAIRNALSGAPAPVLVDFPSDVLHHVEDDSSIVIHDRLEYFPTGRTKPDDRVIEKICDEIIDAKSPLIHAGGGVLRSSAADEVKELAEMLNIPVTTSISGRGSIPEDHPLALVPQNYGAIAAQSGADLVILVGSKLGDLDFFGRPPFWGDSNQKFIQIDIDPDRIGMNRSVLIGALGDAKETLKEIIRRLKEYKVAKRDYNLIQPYKDLEIQWKDQFNSQADEDNIPIHPLTAIKEIRSFFPRDAISIIDGGNTTVWAHYVNRIYTPNTFLSSAAGDSGYIGTGISYAIGAKLAKPDRKVYCISGDGSFGYDVTELETALRLGTNFTCVVLNDSSWGMIKSGQTLYYNKRYVGVDFKDINYADIAKGIGCYGVTVENKKELRDALVKAQSVNVPAVIDVKIPRNLTPPDFQTLAQIWLEGCDSPPEEEIEIEVDNML